MPSARQLKMIRKLARLRGKSLKESVLGGGSTRALKKGETKAYHATSKETAGKIEKEGIRPKRAKMSKTEADKLNKDLKVKDYTDFSYSTMKPNADHYGIRSGAKFEIDLTHPKVKAAATVQPGVEGDLIYHRGGVPRKALKRLYGAGAVATAGVVATQDEAEAMPAAIRKKVLKKIFQEGVESVDKKVLDKLFKSRKGKLYRLDWNPEELAKEGFKPGREAYFDPHDMSGLYYAKSKEGVRSYTGGPHGETSEGVSHNVEAFLHPDAKGTKTGLKGLDEEALTKKYDYIRRGTPEEVIQLKPDKALARIKVGNKWKYRVIGTGAATAGVGLSQTQEAEAMPPNIFQPVKKAVSGVVSSAAKRLKGRTIKGRVIKDIRKSGNTSYRHIIFEDNTEMVVDKKYIHELARVKGTQTYVQKFQEASTESKTTQALKSMQMRESQVQNNPFTTRTMMRGYHKDYLKNVRELGLDAPDTAFVTRQGKHYQMPREYAEHLEGLGILKIVKGKKEQRILRPPTVKPKVGSKRDILRPAAREITDGKLYIGKLGEVHFHVFERYEKNLSRKGNLTSSSSQGLEFGYVDSSGKFLTPEEALRRVPQVKSSLSKKQLDASDYNKQVLNKKQR